MVRLPSHLSATKFPGYFFDLEKKILYTMKMTGVLRPLPVKKRNHFNNLMTFGWTISHKGRNMNIPVEQFIREASKAKTADDVIPIILPD